MHITTVRIGSREYVVTLEKGQYYIASEGRKDLMGFSAADQRAQFITTHDEVVSVFPAQWEYDDTEVIVTPF